MMSRLDAPHRRTRGALMGAVLCAAAICLLSPPSAGAQAVADASCAGPAPLDANLGNGRSSQTFTAQNSGALTRAQILVNKLGTAGDWVVSINTVDGSGATTNTVLASATISDASVPAGEDQTLTADFVSPAAVTVGQGYAVVVGRPDSDTLGIPYAFDNPCPGVNYDSLSQTGPWVDGCGGTCDLVFAVFVEPSDYDQPPDTDPPETTITKGAPKKTRKSKVKFKFVSDEPGSTFECKIDKKPYKPCTSPKKVKRLDDGKHKFKVRATDAAGNVDPSPAKDKFRVVD